jgi:two-component system chemotaxis response regulator CheY
VRSASLRFLNNFQTFPDGVWQTSREAIYPINELYVDSSYKDLKGMGRPVSRLNSLSPPFPMTGVEKRLILLAEDDQDIREMIRESIRVEGAIGNLHCEVTEAVDGADAIEKASKQQFHCVVTDLKMPHSSGEDFIKAIQSSALNANTPTLVVSGHADQEFSAFCHQFAHIRVIAKPVEPAVVAQAVVREIRLGRIDDRVPLHLLNPLLETLQTYLDSELGASSRVLPAAVKKSGEPLHGEMLCSLSFASSVTKTKLYFGFENGFVEALRGFASLQSKAGNFGNLPPESLARLLITEVFERSSQGLAGRMGGTPRLTGLSISTSKSGADANEVLATSGVMIVVETDQGRVSIGALARAKTKRN